MNLKSIANKDFLYLADNLTSKKYRFASSMPYLPHYYSLRDQWEDEKKFEDCVQMIREYGYQKKFGKRTFTYLDINNFMYWTMGAPKEETTVLNRAYTDTTNSYDEVADDYDKLYEDDVYIEENEYIFNLLDIQNEDTVLDIGCGTGLTADNVKLDKDNYVGIDPSKKMIDLFLNKHPTYYNSLIKTGLENFYSGRKFDFVISLFGGCSYCEEDVIKRISYFLKKEGIYFLMMYKENYKPKIYQSHIKEFHPKTYTVDLPGCKVIDYKSYNIITNLKTEYE